MNNREDLALEYRKKKKRIKQRLEEFKDICKSNRDDLFEELSFCLFTPQSKALNCDKAAKELRRSGLLLKGDKEQIAEKLKGRVRFHNNKAGYLIASRKFFTNGKYFDIKDKLQRGGISEAREWFVKNIKGLGYKEASHFLRNIGLGGDVAILDVHILKNLKRYGVIDKIPSSLSRKGYLEIESKMRRFSETIEIPLDELDLLFWSQETGVVFK